MALIYNDVETATTERLPCAASGYFWKKTLIVVSPDTVVRWHRAVFRLYWRLLSRVRKPVGRRPVTTTARLSEVRFQSRHYQLSIIEVLTNEINSFTAELALAQAEGNEPIALVQLYQALGGGWQQ